MCAKIQPLPNGDLLVEYQGHQWRRIAGRWQMLALSDKWFDCEIQSRGVSQQVADFEYCLRTYTLEQGPPPLDRKRRAGESVGEYVRRLQLAELRKGAKNIFAPVQLNYSPGAAHAAETAAHKRKLAAPMPWRTDEYITNTYNETMKAKREQ